MERIAEIERGRSEKFFVEIGPLQNYYPAEEYHQNDQDSAVSASDVLKRNI